MWLIERRRDEKIKAFSSVVIGIINFFMNHYLIVTSSSFLFCSLIGYLNEYLLLQLFDINIVSFAEINDFFLAGLKTPEYLIYFPLFILIIFYLFQIAHKLLKINDDVNKVKGIIEESRSNIKKAKESIQTGEKFLNKIN